METGNRRLDNENMRTNRQKIKKVTDWNGIDGRGNIGKIVQIGERDEDNFGRVMQPPGRHVAPTEE
jgi:hypothetical protein